ncbi:hypothetical protein N8835_03115 [Alphaproteobacteria bacterium]|nr:hypothetical protein [Alphaproteobacteria bacterium]
MTLKYFLLNNKHLLKDKKFIIKILEGNFVGLILNRLGSKSNNIFFIENKIFINIFNLFKINYATETKKQLGGNNFIKIVNGVYYKVITQETKVYIKIHNKLFLIKWY